MPKPLLYCILRKGKRGLCIIVRLNGAVKLLERDIDNEKV